MVSRSAGRGSRLTAKTYQNLKDPAHKQKFIDYIEGRSVHKVPRAISGEARQKVSIAVVPFGIQLPGAPTAVNQYKTSATTQAMGIAKAIQSALTIFGIEDDEVGQTSNSRFEPALARVTIAAPGDTGTNSVSAFTGRTNKKFNSRGGSIPFGRVSSAPTQDYDLRREAVLIEIRGYTTNTVKSVTFVPEYWDTTTVANVNALANVSGGVNFS
ncbi:MAG: hypothetical protein ACRC8A_12655 [Microcoleaceae cyanobacterium]